MPLAATPQAQHARCLPLVPFLMCPHPLACSSFPFLLCAGPASRSWPSSTNPISPSTTQARALLPPRCKVCVAATSGGSSRQQPGFVLQCGRVAGWSAAPISQGLNPAPSCRIAGAFPAHRLTRPFPPSRVTCCSFCCVPTHLPCAGAFPANRFTSYMTSPTSIDVSLKHRQMVSGSQSSWCVGLAAGCCGSKGGASSTSP